MSDEYEDEYEDEDDDPENELTEDEEEQLRAEHVYRQIRHMCEMDIAYTKHMMEMLNMSMMHSELCVSTELIIIACLVRSDLRRRADSTHAVDNQWRSMDA